MEKKEQVLKQYFGYSTFRPGQEELMDVLLAGRDVLGIMPTGAGKSLCFQVPALLLPGTALVVSPLISLMKDQVNALTQNGVRAAFLNSSLTARQYQMAMEHAWRGDYQIIYVAPERLLTEDFLDFATHAELSLFTVDEAHCASHWGHDFRPSYIDIPAFLRQLPRRPPVCAFTATATAEVREDIVKILELQDPHVLVTGFNRENLYFEVRQSKDKAEELLRILEGQAGKSGIVYCSTRKAVEEVCETLCSRGHTATRYHAGLPDEERRQNQEAFLYDRSSVMVATNAFGMGIDKSNVSFVVHYNMPKDLESYYQEAGRAGRDGSPAVCILLYSGQDVVTNQFLIEHGEEDAENAAQQRMQSRERLKQMTYYCHTTDCQRAYILRYFGEQGSDYCGNCGNCNHHFEDVDITVDAQKILSCVKRTGERYGIKMIVDTLRGSKGERVLRLGLDKQTTYGLLADMKEPRLRAVIHCLVIHQYLKISDGEYPILLLGARAGEVLRERRTILVKLPEERPERPPVPEKRQAVKPDRFGVADPQLYERLRTLRSELAKEHKLPPYIIFTNASLEDMCIRKPSTLEELLQVSGVGTNKLERYGQAVLAVLCGEAPTGDPGGGDAPAGDPGGSRE